MLVYGICAVHDEQDIIESLCRYTLLFCDGLIIYDNFSNDRTVEILNHLVAEGLNIHIAQELKALNNTALLEADVRNTMAHMAFTQFQADWVVPVDADEFLSCLSGNNPREAIEGLNPDIEFRIPWRTYVYMDEPTDNSVFLPNYFPYRRQDEILHWYKVLVSRKLWLEKGCRLEAGYHSLWWPDRAQAQTEISRQLFYAHIPVRSRFHTIRKCVLNEFWLAHFPHRPPWHGFQYKVLLDQVIRDGFISRQQAERYSKRFSLPDDIPDDRLCLVKDPLKTDFAGERLVLRYTEHNATESDVLRQIVAYAYKLICDQSKALEKIVPAPKKRPFWKLGSFRKSKFGQAVKKFIGRLPLVRG